MVANQELDQEKVDAFAATMMGVLNGGMLTLLTSIGHRKGLFDTMAGLPPSTSAGIAEAAGLNERYVREWQLPSAHWPDWVLLSRFWRIAGFVLLLLLMVLRLDDLPDSRFVYGVQL